MHVTKLVLKGFRGFGDLEVELARRLTLIVAMNGTGKTSIIEGLAAALGGLVRGALNEPSKELMKGLIGDMDHMREWPSDPALPYVVRKTLTVDASVRWGDLNLSWQLHSQRIITGDPAPANETRLMWTDNRREELLAKFDAAEGGAEPLPLLAALRAPRGTRVEKTNLPRSTAVAAVSAERRARWGANLWLNIQWYYLRDQWYDLEQRSYHTGDRAKAAIQSMVTALMRALGLSEAPYFSADAEDLLVKLPVEGWRSVGLMSDGWRAYVSTIVAIALRCTQINPAQPDAAKITPGVVLIDELEQHLHPALQLEIVDALKRAFPLLQIIATTHSPLVLTDLSNKESDHLLSLDREDETIRVTKLDAPVGRNTLQVLTGSWFGLPSTLDDATLQMLAEHRALLRKGDAVKEERQELEQTLRTRIGRYAETSMEELVLSVVAELEGDSRVKKLSHADLVLLRKTVIDRIKAGLP